MKIAYSGIEGAFANIAAKRIFPQEELISFGDFRSAYEAVEKGDSEYAVLPIENSYAGEVGQVTDLMFQGSLFVNGVYALNVKQNLLGVEGASLASVKKVVSHPQALEQSADFISSHGYESEEAVTSSNNNLSISFDELQDALTYLHKESVKLEKLVSFSKKTISNLEKEVLKLNEELEILELKSKL